MQNITTKGAVKAAQNRRINKTKRMSFAYMAGAWTGGIVPAITYAVAHYQAPDLTKQPWTPSAALWLVVIGGLAYSAPMVAAWMTRYAGQVKAWGFVISLEVAMTFTDHITALPALLTLVTINGIILGNRISQD